MQRMRYHHQAPETRCRECGSLRNTICDGDVTCIDCGLVLDNTVLDYGPEWRSFEDQPDTGNRCGGATSTFENIAEAFANRRDAASFASAIGEAFPGVAGAPKLSSVIGSSVNGQGQGQRQGPETKGDHASSKVVFSTVRRVQQRTAVEGRERSIRNDLETMNAAMQSQFLNLVDDVRNTAARMYSNFRASKQVKDATKRAAMAVCAFYASREKSARSVTEVCRGFDVTEQQFTTARKLVNRSIKETTGPLKREFSRLSHAGGDTSDTLSRVLQTVVEPHQKWEIKKRCLAIQKVAHAHDLVRSNDPERFAMAIVLLACQEGKVLDVTPDTFVRCFKVSASTLTRHVATIKAALLVETKVDTCPNEKK